MIGLFQGDARLEYWDNVQYFWDGTLTTGWVMVADYEINGMQAVYMMAYCEQNDLADCTAGTWQYFDLCKKSGSFQWLTDANAKISITATDSGSSGSSSSGSTGCVLHCNKNAEDAPEWMEAYQQGPETNDEGKGVDVWMLGAIIGGLSVIVIVAVAVAFWKWSTRKSSSKEAETEMVKEVGAANVVHVVDESVAEATG